MKRNDREKYGFDPARREHPAGERMWGSGSETGPGAAGRTGTSRSGRRLTVTEQGLSEPVERPGNPGKQSGTAEFDFVSDFRGGVFFCPVFGKK